MTMMMRWSAGALALALTVAASARAGDAIPSFAELLAHKVALKPELVGVHPRVFVTKEGLQALRDRARTTHRVEWTKVLANLAAMKGAPPPVPGPQERRSQNNVAFAVAEISLAWAVERKPEYLAAAKAWTLAAIDYEPWGYTYNKPNTDLAAGHLLYALGWAYDLLHDDFTPAERSRIAASLERHANLVYDAFLPRPGKTLRFTQNHDFIPTSGLGIAALALMGESKDAERWAALARAHHHRAGQLLSPDGYYYEGMEYWIFSTPWLVHFLDAWEHATGESLWDRDVFRNWKTLLAHALLPDGQNVFDFGDIWEGPLTRAKKGADYERAFPGGALQSNFNVMYRVAARFKDPEAQAIAERYAAFGHSNLEEYWTLLWRDAAIRPAPMSAFPLQHHFKDMGVFYYRTSWEKDALAFAFKAGPPEGHRTAALLGTLPEWSLDSGHAHPDAGSFIIYANGRYLTGDTGYAGLPTARNHNTVTFEGVGQGVEGDHDVWRGAPYAGFDGIRIRDIEAASSKVTIVADLAAAYPKAGGLRSFTRTFAFDGAAFRVSDHFTLASPASIEWRLQSDTPFEIETPGVFRNGVGPAIRVSIDEPKQAEVTREIGKLKVPGPPGSITSGPEEDRGHVLTARTKAPAGDSRIEATIRVVR
ncbi:MAG: heparinase II/III family protein [Vicinamibacteria bacterium]|nr:heparinase II/III family protein [Vicinamibacteria bacterium]